MNKYLGATILFFVLLLYFFDVVEFLPLFPITLVILIAIGLLLPKGGKNSQKDSEDSRRISHEDFEDIPKISQEEFESIMKEVNAMPRWRRIITTPITLYEIYKYSKELAKIQKKKE